MVGKATRAVKRDHGARDGKNFATLSGWNVVIYIHRAMIHRDALLNVAIAPW
jgi:hypothetical protein